MPTAISPLSKTAGGLPARGSFYRPVLPTAARGAGAALPHGLHVRRRSLATGAAAKRHFAGLRRSPQSRSSPPAKQKRPQFPLARRRELGTVPSVVAAGASRRRYHAEPLFPSLAARDVEREESTTTRLGSVVDTFRAPVRFAFAYGSGARAQKGYNQKAKPMIDFIFGVTHPQHWHSLNLTQNPGHYSSCGRLGSRIVTLLQERIGAGVYFNPYVDVNGMEIKYGVTSIDNICADLMNWDTLYIAGRMHKPVRVLRDDARVRVAQLQNLTSALRTALLYLPEEFTEKELFMRIAGLSYQGDFRMQCGTENPNKVHNIVSSQLDAFCQLYGPVIDALPNVAYVRAGTLQQDWSVKSRGLLVQRLPRTLLQGVRLEHGRYLVDTAQIRHRVNDEPDRSQSIAASPELHRYLDRAVHSIIHNSALTQSLKGIITAGLTKSLRYALEKIRKGAERKGGET